MFGHDDEQQQTNGGPTPDAALGGQGQTVEPTNNAQGAPAVSGSGVSSQDYIMTDPPAPAQPTTAVDDGMSTDNAAPAASAAPASTASTNDDLLNIKQQALQQLAPLVDHLDQTPEEKFRTTMMMIQASDNDALIKEAYDAAQNISDEKTRAQALLDIVNEINYFTQNPQS